MLTQLEIKAMNVVYSCICNKRLIIPPLSWDNLKLSVCSQHKRVSNWIMMSIVLLETIYYMQQIATLTEQGDIKSAILHIIFLERFICHFFLRLNTVIFKTELARLINQTSDINIKWG